MSDLVDRLLASMTLEENSASLNMFDAGMPPDAELEMERQIAAGRIGSLLNIYEPDRLNRWQAIALESRLKIPLIFGLDVCTVTTRSIRCRSPKPALSTPTCGSAQRECRSRRPAAPASPHDVRADA